MARNQQNQCSSIHFMGLGREKKVYLRGEMPALFGKSSHTARRERSERRRVWREVAAYGLGAAVLLDAYTWPGKSEDPQVPSIIHAWDMNTKAWKHSGGNPLRYLAFKYSEFGRDKLAEQIQLAKKEQEELSDPVSDVAYTPDQT
jgi:hypothetical protein